MYYDKQGNPITLEEWSEKLSDFNYKIIEQTQLKNCWVSTVWLGLDHNFLLTGLPLIFETMVFKGSLDDRDWSGEETERYHTEEEAKEGHKKMVEKYTNL